MPASQAEDAGSIPVSRSDMKYISRILTIILLLLPAVVIFSLVSTEYFATLQAFVQSNYYLFIVSVLVMKAASIIYPPLPGVTFTAATIPLIGWEAAYALDITGSFFGASASYFLGKKYGETLVRKAVGDTIANKLTAITLKPKNQVEASFFLRFAGGGVLSDGIAWGASLIGFRYLPFIIGYVVSHLASTLPIFYLIAQSISANSWVVILATAVCAWLVIYTFKGRYFE